MRWTVLQFGRHQGQTLPQIVLSDPDWFFWAIAKGVFQGRLSSEAEILAGRATHIKIPKRDWQGWEVEYRYERNGRFCGFGFVEAYVPPHSGSHVRLPYFDLSCAPRSKAYDKQRCKVLIADFRRHYFGENTRLTKQRCEKFFDNQKNFLDDESE